MYDWDKRKAKANRAKHGVAFSDMAGFDWDSAVFIKTGIIDHEVRETVIGAIGVTSLRPFTPNAPRRYG